MESEDESSEESEIDAPAAFQSERMKKTGIYWSENLPSRTQTRSFNILRQGPGPVRGSRIATPEDAFEFLITREIIDEVIQCTNLEGRRVAAAREKDWKIIDYEEFVAFIGLTLLAGVEKDWDVAVRELFSDALQNPMYRATMAVRRYEDIRRLLRFDDKRTRAETLKTDHLAAFSHIRELFLSKEAMKRCGLTFNYSNPVQQQQAPASKRKRCHICPYSKDRKVRCYCSQCHEAVSLEHSTTLVTCIKCNAE